MSRVIHFEIHADDPKRAVAFYTNVFGWTIKKWEGGADYWLISTGPDSEPGINGAIMKRQTKSPKGNEAIIGFVSTIQITNIEETLKKLTSNGGSIILPKQAIAGVGWLSYAKDTEGNVIGLMQNDKEAK